MSPPAAKFTLRLARPSDLPQLTKLGRQLGYENTIEAFDARFTELSTLPDHIVYVVEAFGEATPSIAGMAHFKIHRSLLVEASLEVGGVVVDEIYRGQGLGKMLLAQAEKTARDWNLTAVRLFSNVQRGDAHQFYLKLGYTQPKTSHFFIKTV